MAIKNPKRINYAIDYSPYAAKNQTAADGLAALYDAVDEINGAMATVKDPRTLAKAVAQRSASALAKARKRQEQVGMQSAKHMEEIRAVLKRRNVEFEREIREHVKASKSPANEVRKMIAAGDESVFTILRAPPYLSGLTDELHSDLYQYAKTKFCPEIAEKEAAADHSIDLLDRAIKTFEAESTRLTKSISTSDEAIALGLITPKTEPAQ